MSSRLEGVVAPERRERSGAAVFLVWNRRLHYYLGLYLLFFSWLFVFTGLLLNHPGWEFAQFWPNRVQRTTEQQFQMPEATTDVARARDLMQQVGIAGEIQWPGAQPTDGAFAFQVSRPGAVIDVKADLRSNRVMLTRTEVNAWGVMHVLHTFTGMPAAGPRNQRDWILTTAWALSMDAVAAGLIFMVFSSYIMGYRLKAKRAGGTIALALGVVICGAFVAGLGWLMGSRPVEPQITSCPRTIMSPSLKRAVIAWAPSGMTSVTSSSTAVMDGAPSAWAGNTNVTSGMRG